MHIQCVNGARATACDPSGRRFISGLSVLPRVHLGGFRPNCVWRRRKCGEDSPWQQFKLPSDPLHEWEMNRVGGIAEGEHGHPLARRGGSSYAAGAVRSHSVVELPGPPLAPGLKSAGHPAGSGRNRSVTSPNPGVTLGLEFAKLNCAVGPLSKFSGPRLDGWDPHGPHRRCSVGEKFPLRGAGIFFSFILQLRVIFGILLDDAEAATLCLLGRGKLLCLGVAGNRNLSLFQEFV